MAGTSSAQQRALELEKLWGSSSFLETLQQQHVVTLQDQTLT
jgi:hypothetical protein